MATRLYLKDDGAAATWGAAYVDPWTELSVESDDESGDPSGKLTLRTMEEAVGSSEQDIVCDERDFPAVEYRWFRNFTSKKLAAQTLPAGMTTQVTVACKASIGITGYLGILVYIWDDTLGIVKYLSLDLAVDTKALSVQQRWRTVTETMAGVAFSVKAGQRLVVELWVKHSQPNNFQRWMHTYFEGSTDDYAVKGENQNVTDSASWVETSVDLKFYSPGVLSKIALVFPAGAKWARRRIQRFMYGDKQTHLNVLGTATGQSRHAQDAKRQQRPWSGRRWRRRRRYFVHTGEVDEERKKKTRPPSMRFLS